MGEFHGAQVPVAVSARHVHLTEQAVARLFGAGHQLRVLQPLRQPGQFAAFETVTLIGPRGRIPHVRVVGPARADNQVELSRTDELTLGLDAPLRLSGDLESTPGITLQGPAGALQLERGVLMPRRHLHASPQDAARLGVHDHELIAVALRGDGRDLVFADVVVRISPSYRLELHLDTDEANAAGLRGGEAGELLLPYQPLDCVAELINPHP